MSYIVNLAIKARSAVVIGAGSVASRKINDLLEAGAFVVVIAPAACPQVEELAAASRIRLHRRRYAAGDLQEAFLVIAATDDEELNAQVSRDAESLGRLVNVVDRPALCTFTMPAVLRRDDLTIAVSTEGRCPALSGVMREELSVGFGPEYAEVVHVFGEIRREMIAQGWSGRTIRENVRQLYHAGIVEVIRTDDREALVALLRTRLGAAFPVPPSIGIGRPIPTGLE